MEKQNNKPIKMQAVVKPKMKKTPQTEEAVELQNNELTELNMLINESANSADDSTTNDENAINAREMWLIEDFQKSKEVVRKWQSRCLRDLDSLSEAARSEIAPLYLLAEVVDGEYQLIIDDDAETKRIANKFLNILIQQQSISDLFQAQASDSNGEMCSEDTEDAEDNGDDGEVCSEEELNEVEENEESELLEDELPLELEEIEERQSEDISNADSEEANAKSSDDQ